jgi:hypothetical protein
LAASKQGEVAIKGTIASGDKSAARWLVYVCMCVRARSCPLLGRRLR